MDMHAFYKYLILLVCVVSVNAGFGAPKADKDTASQSEQNSTGKSGRSKDQQGQALDELEEDGNEPLTLDRFQLPMELEVGVSVPSNTHIEDSDEDRSVRPIERGATKIYPGKLTFAPYDGNKPNAKVTAIIRWNAAISTVNKKAAPDWREAHVEVALKDMQYAVKLINPKATPAIDFYGNGMWSVLPTQGIQLHFWAGGRQSLHFAVLQQRFVLEDKKPDEERASLQLKREVEPIEFPIGEIRDRVMLADVKPLLDPKLHVVNNPLLQRLSLYVAGQPVPVVLLGYDAKSGLDEEDGLSYPFVFISERSLFDMPGEQEVPVFSVPMNLLFTSAEERFAEICSERTTMLRRDLTRFLTPSFTVTVNERTFEERVQQVVFSDALKTDCVTSVQMAGDAQAE